MIKPLNRNIIVKEQEFKEKSESGLIFTTTTKKAESVAVVLAMATDCKFDIKVGDTVFYNQFDGAKIVYNNEEYLVLSEESLYGVG